MSPVDLQEIRYLRPRARRNPACDLPQASLLHDFAARAAIAYAAFVNFSVQHLGTPPISYHVYNALRHIFQR
ncbi:MAG: hypothetical protein JW841_13150 [Deltaproteobacteria bacterium]|nr:hypothetical protein [Deltaproteobacteria bacterium]